MITLSQPSTCKIRDDFLIFFGLQDQACSPSSSSYETQETRIKKSVLFHDFVVWHLHGILTHFAHYFKKWFDHQHICNQYTEHVVTTTNATCFPGSLPPPLPLPPGGRGAGRGTTLPESLRTTLPRTIILILVSCWFAKWKSFWHNVHSKLPTSNESPTLELSISRCRFYTSISAPLFNFLAFEQRVILSACTITKPVNHRKNEEYVF